MYILYRVYSCFTLETIIATAFGRQVNLQRGESDEFTKAMDIAMKGLCSGQVEDFMLLDSMFHMHNMYIQSNRYCIDR